MDFASKIKLLEQELAKSFLSQKVAEALPPDLKEQYVSERRQKARSIQERRRTSRDKDLQSFMVPQLANKKGFNRYMQTAKPGGVFVMMDGNRFKRINDTFGHSVGDSAIKAMGSAVDAARQGLKSPHVVSHWGGDEFAAHFEDPADAANFAKRLEEHLGNVVPIVGEAIHDKPGFFRGMAQKAGLAKPQVHTHHLSMAVGMGETFDQADAAQYRAKGARDKAGAAPGHDKTYVHSLHPAHLAAPPATVAAPIRKSEPDFMAELQAEAQLAKSVPIHDGAPVPVYYLRDEAGPVTALGDIVQGWLEEPVLDNYGELRKSGKFLAVAQVATIWPADEGVAFRL